MENFHHDTHQFYFERYLRKKMNAKDRLIFESKLNEDEALRAAFEHYKKNRKQLMRELINEHTSNPYKTWISTFIYISIAAAAIIVALNLHWQNKALEAERERDKNLISTLLDKIPFVNKHQKQDNKQHTEKSKPNKVNTPKETPPKKKEEPKAVTSLVLKDTVLVPLSRSYMDQRITFYQQEIDSTLTVAELLNLIYKNSSKYADKHKSRAIGVEFIQHSELTNAYKFDGNKLWLYGVAEHTPVLLVKDENELVWIKPNNEVILVADNTIHTF
jgi:hypothetical protein